MILSELIAYLAERKCAALPDISLRLGSDPEAVRMMLSMLERRGQVRKLPTGSACTGGCSRCDPTSIEIYEWLDIGGPKGGRAQRISPA
jgi:putative ferrous iron transport protein C